MTSDNLGTSLEIQPYDSTLGAEVVGLDRETLFAPAGEPVVHKLHRALHRHQVLFFPRVGLDLDELSRFSELFGPVMTDRKKEGEAASEQILGRPDLKVLSNAIGESGKPVGDKGAEAQSLHIDGTHRATPNAFSILYGRQAPEPPPRTSFVSLYTIYEALPTALKREVARLEAIHSLHNRSQSFSDVMESASEPVERRAEGARHPLVTLHPDTLRPCLYLPRRRDALVVGYSPERSRKLMERLWAEVFRNDAVLSTALRAGDLVLFDNRAVMHDRESWDPEEPRIVLHVAMAPQAPAPAFPTWLNGPPGSETERSITDFDGDEQTGRKSPVQ